MATSPQATRTDIAHADTVFIHNIAVQTLIGILPHERAKQQTLIINVDLATDFSDAQRTDKVDDALNYAAISEFIVDFAAEAQYQLLERFGHELCQALFDNYPATAIHLRITKPGAIAHTQTVGITMSRRRNNPN